MFWQLLRDPFQGHPVNTFAVLLATLVVDKQGWSLVHGGEVRSGRSESTAKEEEETLIATEQATKHAAQQKKVRSEKEKRNEMEGRTEGGTEGRTTKLPKND